MNFLPLLRSLANAYQAFEGYSIPHIRSLGLTSVQFDVIATLANQPPMTYKELGEKTLISKSSLTGVIERMSNKGLIALLANQEDGRSQKIKLTAKGHKLFEKTFPAHLGHLDRAFSQLTNDQLIEIKNSLNTLQSIFKVEKS
jgi:hypothetical protein